MTGSNQAESMFKVRKPAPAPVAFLHRHLGKFFWGLLAGAIVGFLSIETVFNGGFHESVRALWIPLALGMLYFLWYVRPQRGILWIWVPLVYGMVLLMSWPYVMLVNALLPAKGEQVYEGPVVRKWMSSGRRVGYQLVIKNEADSKEVTLTVSKPAYEKTKEGDRLVSRFTLGGFGIPYRWRYNTDAY